MDKFLCIHRIRYRIPFGAEDGKYLLCIEKTKSELIERLVWINIYLQNREFKNTLGFAAHTDITKAAINSVLEFYERKIFNELCHGIIENKELSDKFEIVRKRNTTLFIKPIEYRKEQYYLVYSFSNNGKVAFGMGKNSCKNDAIEDSIREKNVIQKTLINEIKDKSCMTYDEWHQFNDISLSIGTNNTIFQDDVSCRKKIIPEVIDEKEIVIYDMEYFIPTEVGGERKVTLCMEIKDERNNWMKRRNVYAIEI